MSLEKMNFISCVAYTIMNAVGSGVLLGAFMLTSTTNSTLCINLSIMIAAMVILIFSLSCAKLAKIFPKGGGNATYIGETFHPLGLTIHNIIMCFVYSPSVICLFVDRIAAATNFYPMAMFGICSPLLLTLGMLTTKARFYVTKAGSAIQLSLIITVFILLAVALGFKENSESYLKENLNISFGVSEFLESTLTAFFMFSTFDACNYRLNVEFPGGLKKPYAFSIILITSLYFYYINSFLALSPANELITNLSNLLTFMPGGVAKGFDYVCNIGLCGIGLLGGMLLFRDYIDRLIPALKNSEIKTLCPSKKDYKIMGIRFLCIFAMFVITNILLYLENFGAVLIGMTGITMLFYTLSFTALFIKIYKKQKEVIDLEDCQENFISKPSSAKKTSIMDILKKYSIPVISILLSCLLTILGFYFSIKEFIKDPEIDLVYNATESYAGNFTN